MSRIDLLAGRSSGCYSRRDGSMCVCVCVYVRQENGGEMHVEVYVRGYWASGDGYDR